MKSTTFVLAALLCCGALLLSAPAFAEGHTDRAKEMKKAAAAMRVNAILR